MRAASSSQRFQNERAMRCCSSHRKERVSGVLDRCKKIFKVLNTIQSLTAGVVNHMAPGGQRMPELAAITLLEQVSRKRRMLRVFSGKVCVIADYTKGEGLESSDLEVGYWFADNVVSAHILRIVRGLDCCFVFRGQLVVSINTSFSDRFLETDFAHASYPPE